MKKEKKKEIKKKERKNIIFGLHFIESYDVLRI